MRDKSIVSLSDLLGREVVFNYYEVDDNGDYRFDDDDDVIMKEIKGIVSSAYIDDFSFYYRWNEPLYIRIQFKPLEDRSIYKNISEEDLICIFTDEYNLESIIEIIN